MNCVRLRLAVGLMRVRCPWTGTGIRVLTTKTGIKPSTPQSPPFIRAFKYFAIGLLSIGCLKIFPYVGEFTVASAVGLLDSDDAFFVKVGLKRISKSVRTEAGAKTVIENGFVSKCIKHLNDKATDPKLLSSILDTLEALSEFECVQQSYHEENLLPCLERAFVEGRLDHCHSQIHTIRWKLRGQD